MGFDCGQCRARCKADCCRGPIPIPRETLERFPTVRPILSQDDIGGGHVMVLAVDEATRDPVKQTVQGCCPYLGFDNLCSIYEHRPLVCRTFGSGIHPMMTCSFQAPDGRIRARPERRAIERAQVEARDQQINRLEVIR